MEQQQIQVVGGNYQIAYMNVVGQSLQKQVYQ